MYLKNKTKQQKTRISSLKNISHKNYLYIVTSYLYIKLSICHAETSLSLSETTGVRVPCIYAQNFFLQIIFFNLIKKLIKIINSKNSFNIIHFDHKKYKYRNALNSNPLGVHVFDFKYAYD